MVSVYVWVAVGAGALLVAYIAFTFIKIYLDDRERRQREAEGGGPYSSSSNNENGYLGLNAFRDSKGNDAGGLEYVREGVDRGGINSGATAQASHVLSVWSSRLLSRLRASQYRATPMLRLPVSDAISTATATITATATTNPTVVSTPPLHSTVGSSTSSASSSSWCVSCHRTGMLLLANTGLQPLIQQKASSATFMLTPNASSTPQLSIASIVWSAVTFASSSNGVGGANANAKPLERKNSAWRRRLSGRKYWLVGWIYKVYACGFLLGDRHEEGR
ncbi:hypothetical protein PHYPSEUDO_004268 [Phytophthora pseudosyringae]|uniref:Uncharacterized protein n=1 Tax=Phytophthora pseudosyringae TaxID=221518 RepID=A0A8T1VRT2_9STRA|nr:hypothetical protein PHYPSEUDO_004268 [Phytophthora pseudosyringae]